MARPRNDQFTKEQFYFWRCDPGTGLLSENEWKIKFEAHITSINDSSSPGWNENYDMGRADPVLFYSGMSRTINVSFKVIALNSEEHYNNHELYLAKLGKMTYPIYKSGLGYNAPHVYFQIGNLYKGFGVLTSFNTDWDGEAVWIEGRPIYTDVSVSIRVLADSNGKRPAVTSRYYI